MSLTNRQVTILFEVISAYVEAAEPVSSGEIARRGVDASPATIRAELAALEAQGYLVQPHTSAGRAPTPAAYELYVEHIQQQAARIAAERVERFARLIAEVAADVRLAGHAIARALASEARQAVVVGIAHGDAYATGLSYVVVQPEFHDRETLYAFTAGFDDLDNTIAVIDAQLTGDAAAILGDGNPFGGQCGTVAGHLALPEGHRLTIGIAGPMRMAYDRQFELLRDIRYAAMGIV
ncbi:MAG: hypothetical protein Q7T01_01385 [bacterium]|nr:hypothetical protein [bacterium]